MKLGIGCTGGAEKLKFNFDFNGFGDNLKLNIEFVFKTSLMEEEFL